jgi:hypothetical protein
MPHAGRDEEMTRHLIDGVQNGKVLDPLLVELLHQPPSRRTIFLF